MAKFARQLAGANASFGKAVQVRGVRGRVHGWGMVQFLGAWTMRGDDFNQRQW